MWNREEDGTYVTEMAELSRNPTHPVTGLPVSGAFMLLLTPHIVGEEIVWWYGKLEDGTRVLIYND